MVILLYVEILADGTICRSNIGICNRSIYCAIYTRIAWVDVTYQYEGQTFSTVTYDIVTNSLCIVNGGI